MFAHVFIKFKKRLTYSGVPVGGWGPCPIKNTIMLNIRHISQQKKFISRVKNIHTSQRIGDILWEKKNISNNKRTHIKNTFEPDYTMEYNVMKF